MARGIFTKAFAAVARRVRRAMRRLLGLEADRQEMLGHLDRLYNVLEDMEARIQVAQRQSEHALAFVEELPSLQARAEERFLGLRDALADLSQRHDLTVAGIDSAAGTILAATEQARELFTAQMDEVKAGLERRFDDGRLQTEQKLGQRLDEGWLQARQNLTQLEHRLDEGQRQAEQGLTQLEHRLVEGRLGLSQALAKQIGDSEAALRAQGATLLDRTAMLHALQDAQGHIRFQVNESLDLVRLMHSNLLHRPIYIQPGMMAVTRLGGWDGHPLAVPTTHAGVLYGHYVNGANSEPGVRAAIRSLVKPGDVAIDIGAHVGLHSVIMGFHVGEEGQLLCFEPDPDLAAALQQTMLMNGYWRRARVINAAVADAPGRVAFHRVPHSPESTLFPEDGTVERDVIDVEVTSLDAALAPGSQVNFVKIDAEGAESRIFRGMQRVLKDNRRLSIIVEFAPQHFARAGETPDAFLDSLKKQGFEIFTVGDEDGGLTPVEPGEVLQLKTCNLLLKRE